MEQPVMIINLKTYHTKQNVLRLAKTIESVDKTIIVAAQPTDIMMITQHTQLRVLAQHIDTCEPGRHTGFITAEAVKAAGAQGVLINHSEHPLDTQTIKKTLARARKARLKTYVFANNAIKAQAYARMRPDYIIYEPQELVGGKTSVAKAKPTIIEHITHALKVPVLVGAGIHTKEDIAVATKRGAAGIALASAVTTASNPKKILQELRN